MKKKRLLSIIFILSLIVLANQKVYGRSGNFLVNGIYYDYGEESQTAIVVGLSSDITELIIPQTVTYGGKTMEVVEIGNYAFWINYALTSVTIPESVKKIGSYAFAKCYYLSSINIPESVETIEVGAFQDCTSLNAVHISDLSSWCKIGFDTSLSNPLCYADHLYLNGVEIIDLVITDDVTTINDYAFNRWNGLKTVSIEGNHYISIGYEAFAWCNELESVHIESNPRMGRGVFYGCNNISYVSINSRYVDSSFSDLKNLEEVVIGDNVETISYGAFSGCIHLATLSIGKSVLEIENKAFDDCDYLSSLSINCPKIDTWFREKRFLKNVYIGNNVEEICAYAFEGCSRLESIVIPNNVKRIGCCAFMNCSSLTSIVIPDSVTSIESSTFYGCQQLSSVIIGNNVTSIGSSSFAGCSNLTSLTIGNSVTEIGSGAFSGCSITRLRIPNSVKKIQDRAFSGCSNLSDIYIGDGVTYIGEFAFSDCNESGAFVYITDLVSWLSINFEHSSSNPLSSAHNLYLNDKELKELIIPDNVTNINNYAFYGCSSLMSLNLNKVNRIGDFSFSGCNSISTLCVPNSVTQVGRGAFSKCNNLETVLWLSNFNYRNNECIPNGSSVYGYSKPEIIGMNPIINIQATNRTLKIEATNEFEIKSISDIDGSKGIKENGGYLFKDLSINSIHKGTVKGKFMQWDDVEFTVSESTKPIDVSFINNNGVTKVTLNGTHSAIDATVTESGFIKNKQNQLLIEGLDPNTSYNETFYLRADDDYYQTATNRFSTTRLTMETQVAQAISDTKMRLMAETNCDDEAMRCGFEWRRYDAPDEMPSSSACCAVYNGYLMGTLSNLTPNVYYKYRPYYKADSGRKYYGNWVAFLTADAAVFFEPEVHTFEAQEVTEQKAKVRGYVLAGSDDIIEQGFEYWSNTGNHLMQVSSGMLMSTTINNLTEETDYYYRSYVKTDKKTLYGEELSFRTLAKGVVGVNDQMIPQVNSETIYDLTGRKVDHLIKRRLYIRNGKKFIAR